MPSVQDKSPEEPGPLQASQIAPAEAGSKVNWDVLGFASAALTLGGTAIFFIVGWAYDSNWFGYYGLRMDQVNTPPQQTLLYSLPTLYFLFFFVLIAFLLNGLRARPLGYESKSLSGNDLVIVLRVTTILLFATALIASLQNTKDYLSNISNNSIQSYLSLTGDVIVIVLFLPFSKEDVRRLLHPQEIGSYIQSRLDFLLSRFGQWQLAVLGFSAFLIAMSLSAALGIIDAKAGRKGDGGHVQQVVVISQKPLAFLSQFELSCNSGTNCVYGPFGLVAENSESLYLAEWPKERIGGVGAFPRTPQLFELPRIDANGGYSLVLAPSLQLAGRSNSDSGTSMPTPTLAVTPRLTPIITSTLMPASHTTSTPTKP